MISIKYSPFTEPNKYLFMSTLKDYIITSEFSLRSRYRKGIIIPRQISDNDLNKIIKSSTNPTQCLFKIIKQLFPTSLGTQRT